jgi:hypothetical protein
MRMPRKMSYALVAVGIALSTPAVAASPAAAAPAAPPGCALEGTKLLFDRTVNFWNCRVANQITGRGHGQIVNGQIGDSVEMQYFSLPMHRWVSVGTRVVTFGPKTIDSGSLPPELMFSPRACIRLGNVPFATACT